MAVIINNIDDSTFEVNGIPYTKMYEPFKQGNTAFGIIQVNTGAFIEDTSSTSFQDYIINGVTYNTLVEAMAAALNITFGFVLPVSVSEEFDQKINEINTTGAKSYQTLAEAQVLVLNDNTSVKIVNDSNAGNNGYYTSVSNTLIKDSDLAGVEADEVVKGITIESNNLINSNNIANGYYGFGANKITNSNNWIYIDYQDIPEGVQGQLVTVSGGGNIPDAASLVTFRNASGSTMQGSQITGVIDLNNPYSFTVPNDAVRWAFTIANDSSNGGVGSRFDDNIYTDTFKVELGDKNTLNIPTGKRYVSESSIQKNPKIYYEFFNVDTTYTGVLQSLTVGYVYVHLKDSKYAGYKLVYNFLEDSDYTSGVFFGGKVLRIAGANLFNLVNNVMVDTDEILMLSSESEFVLNAGEWVGGFHGNEIYSSVNFLANGKLLNDGQVDDLVNTGLQACDSFKIISNSNLLRYEDFSVLAERGKIIDFKDGSFQIDNKLKWGNVRTLFAYTGITCMGKKIGSVCFDDFGNSYIPVDDNNNLINQVTDYRTIYYFNKSTGLRGSVTNTIKGDVDNEAHIILWDRSDDTKYYRRANYLPVTGEILETTTVNQIFMD